MKISEAIKEARRRKSKISSESLGMFSQSAKNLVYWLMDEDGERNDVARMILLKHILSATDWQLDVDFKFKDDEEI